MGADGVAGALVPAEPRSGGSLFVPHDRAALILRPVGEAQIVNPDVVIARPQGGEGRKGRAPAAVMGDDAVTGAEPGSGQQRVQVGNRLQAARTEEVGMRQKPGTGQMPAP